MRFIPFTCCLLIAACSGNPKQETPKESPESSSVDKYLNNRNKESRESKREQEPQLQEFKVAVKKFISEGKLFCNAVELGLSRSEVVKYKERVLDALVAIPKVENNSAAKKIRSTAQVLKVGFDLFDVSFSLDLANETKNSSREQAKRQKEELKMLEQDLDNLE